MANSEITLTLDQAVEKVRGHRIRGELKEAFDLLNQFLKDHMGSASAVSEAWMICLLNEQASQGRLLLDILRRLPQGSARMERSWLLTHERVTGERPPELEQAALPGPAWSAEVSTLRGFRELEPKLGGLELSCDGGVAVFSFTWNCPACALAHRAKSLATLDVVRLFYCPGCAAPQLLDGRALADATLERHPILAGGELQAHADEAANRLQDAVGRFDDPAVPPMCRMLNQEIVSFFNECLFRRIQGS